MHRLHSKNCIKEAVRFGHSPWLLGTRVQFEQPGASRIPTGVLAVLSERLSDTIDRGSPIISFLCRHLKGIGWVNSRPTQPSSPIIFSILQVINKANAGPDRQARKLCAASATGRWWLEHLLRRAIRAERHHQGLRRVAVGREMHPNAITCSERPGEFTNLEASNRANSYTRLYLALVGAVGWDMVPGDPSRADAAPQLVRDQHLRDVVVDARELCIPLSRSCMRISLASSVPGGVCVDELYRDPLPEGPRPKLG